MVTSSGTQLPQGTTLCDLYRCCRATSLALTEGLSPEDMGAQSMEDASPTKWHLAHTTWFFEQFVLRDYVADYVPFDAAFQHLFNSYYEAVGRPFRRARRGLLTRPSIARVLQYRQAVDATLTGLLTASESVSEELEALITLGIHHEIQHQELLLTDILHCFSLNPLLPAKQVPAKQLPGKQLPGKQLPAKQAPLKPHQSRLARTLEFVCFDAGLYAVGAAGEQFSFDCERPRHRLWLQPFALANRPVTNGEWLQFMQDGGYEAPTLWLSDGWARRQLDGWTRPLYWFARDDQWYQFSLSGLQPLDPTAPVCHISYFEADAYARWAGARLPSEQEWEVAAQQTSLDGNYAEARLWQPQAASVEASGLMQLFGDVWEWTQSPFSPYPGFHVSKGAVGEYNGKFMCGQFVLRGGSCVTPQAQLRGSYRNFFYPHQRWQFSGLRLARDAQ